MNTDTGQIYRDVEEIKAAKSRGENVVEVSPQVAELMELAQAAKSANLTVADLVPQSFKERREANRNPVKKPGYKA
jgi:hypothetical protein